MYECETCVYYPPSSLDGKPCCMCDTSNPLTSCYCEKEEDEAVDDEYEEEDYDPWDDYDWCYECTGYGDDYSYDEDGELVSNCDDCPHNPNRRDPWDD